MVNEIYDLKLQRKYQQALAKSPFHAKILRPQLYCGVGQIKQLGVEPATFIVSNKKTANFFGIISCKNSWTCPHCAPKRMAQVASDIACAIDALKKRNQIAFMITFTIPHTSGMSCQESTEILYNTWKAFIIRGNHNRTTHNHQTNDPFAAFCEEFNCKHRVRVGEYTYGNAGWHPHFHCLFWVDRHKFQQVKDWQDILCNRWLELTKRNTLKQWNKGATPTQREKNKIRLEIMYSKLNNVSKPAYISVDKNNRVIQQESSMYICGWGADKELTGNINRKASHKGHLTPFQILEKAKPDPEDPYMKLYLEYATATIIKKHKRVNFSTQSGIRKIIAQWKLTNTYKEVLKKKAMSNQNTDFKVVCWFNEQNWLQICLLDQTIPIKTKILELALQNNAKEKIDQFLEQYNIKSSNRIHSCQTFLENEIFNKAC